MYSGSDDDNSPASDPLNQEIDFNNDQQPHPEDIKLEFEHLDSDIFHFLSDHSSIRYFTPAKITPFLQNLVLVLRQHIRGSYATDELLIEKIMDIGSFSSLCGKLLPSGELYFCCFDCDLLGKNEITNVGNTVQCKECFEKANHEGHKVATRLSTGGAVCDCGDAAVWDKEGFCPSHQGFSSEKAMKMTAQIPSDIEKTFVSTFSELLYLIFRLIEDNKLVYVDIQSYFIHVAGVVLLDFCQKADGFKLLTSKLLMSTLSEKWLFKHNCDDIEKMSFRETKGPCNCTILELLLRFSTYLNEHCQAVLKDLFLDLFVNHEFRKYFTTTYIKMAYFSYVVEASSQQRTHDNVLQNPVWELKSLNCTETKMNSLTLQMLMTDDLSLAAVESSYFNQIFDLLRKLLYFTGVKDRINTASSLFYSVSSNLSYIFARPTPSIAALQKTGVFEALFSLLMDFQSADRLHLHEFLSNITAERCFEYYSTQAVLANRILEIMSSLLSHPFKIEDDSAKQKIIKNFRVLVSASYKKCKEKDQNSPLFGQGKITMNSLLFHALGAMVSYLIVENPDLTFNDEEFEILWEDALYESLKSLIFYKFLANIPESVHSLLSLKDLLMNIHEYHFSASDFADYEVLLAQISLLRLKDKSRVKAVMKNLLSYTCDEKDPNSAALTLVWKRTCFEVFSFVVRDESCYANIHKKQVSLYFKPANKAKPTFDAIAKKMIVNYLHISPFQKLEEIELGLKPCVLLGQDQHVLDSIVNVSEQTKKLRLREEWQNRGLDPQIFYKNTRLTQMLQSVLKEIAVKDANFNIILGCPEPLTLPFLYDVERTGCLWILSDLEMLNEIIHSFVERKVDVVGVLRFLSICVRILEKSSYKDLMKAIDLTTLKVLRESIEKLIIKLKSAKELEDYVPSVEKLLGATERIEKKLKDQVDFDHPMNEERKIEVNSQMSGESEDKRNKMLQKQREIKERFLKKQQNFMAKAKDTTTLDSPQKTLENNGQNSIICNYCHEVIKTDAEKYGYLAFLTRSNFADYCKAYKEQSEANAKEPKAASQYNLWKDQKADGFGYFTITSCQHSMHSHCFELFQNKKVIDAETMNAPNEFFCTFCKALCNIFIPIPLTTAKSESQNTTSLTTENLSLNSLMSAVVTDPKELFKGLEAAEVKKDEESDVFGAQLFITNLTIAERLELDEFADQPEDIVRKMVLQYAELIEIISLQRFYNSRAHLLKACSTLTRNLYWNQLKQYEGALSDKILNLRKDLSLMTLTEANSTEEAVAFAKDFIFEAKNSTTFILKAIWDMYFAERGLTQGLGALIPNMILFGTVLELLKLFIEEKLLEDPESISDPIKHATIDTFKQYLVENIDFDLPTVLTYLRKIVAVTSSIGYFNLESDYKDLLKSSQILSLILGLEKTNVSVKDVLKQFVTANEKTFGMIFKGISEYVRKKLDPKEIRIFFDGLKGSTVAVLTLPEDYQGFRALFQKQKCHLCYEFPLTGRGTVCLICGKFMCVSACKDRKRRQMAGNLNEHAREYHCGVAAFIDTELSFVFLLNSPKNVVFRHLYENKYGQSIDRLDQRVEWRDYKLNEQAMNELKNLIVENQIPQKICRLIDENESRFGDNQL